MYQPPQNPVETTYTPPLQPSYPPPPPQGYSPQQSYYPPPSIQQPPKRRRRLWLWIIGILVVLAITGSFASRGSTTTNTPPAATQVSTGNTPAATQAPAATPTPQSIHYPPTTVTDLRGLAAEGDASAIHEFHSENVGAAGVCPQPKREVTVAPSVTGKQLAEDLLAYFYGQQLDSPCGSVVFAYHHQGEANDAYTAGRILFDVTDASGSENLEPNATNLTHTLTLDIGGFSTGKEYVVTY